MPGSGNKTVSAFGAQARGTNSEAVAEDEFSSSQARKLNALCAEVADDPKGENLALAGANEPGARAMTTDKIEGGPWF